MLCSRNPAKQDTLYLHEILVDIQVIQVQILLILSGISSQRNQGLLDCMSHRFSQLHHFWFVFTHRLQKRCATPKQTFYHHLFKLWNILSASDAFVKQHDHHTFEALQICTVLHPCFLQCQV